MEEPNSIPAADEALSTYGGCVWGMSKLLGGVLALLFFIMLLLGIVSTKTFIIALILAISIVVIGQVIANRLTVRFRQSAVMRQKDRDVRAKKILHILQKGHLPDRPFFVFLRPFSTAGRYLLHLGSFAVYPGSQSLPDEKDLETSLSRLVSPFGDFISLGRELENIGAGRIASDDDRWRSIVRLVCQAATGIIMVPMASEGTSWEMILLRDEALLNKTVFIMPPHLVGEIVGKFAQAIGKITGDKGNIQIFNESAPLDWKTAKPYYKNLGINLSDFHPDGLAFFLNRNGIPTPICHLSVKISQQSIDKSRSNLLIHSQLGERIQKIGVRFGTDWFPVLAALGAPASQHLLPLLEHLTFLTEKELQRRSTYG